MLTYESKPVLPPEPAWRVAGSVCLGGLACAVGLWLWWQTAPGLWTLATFTPRGPIRPMGFVAGLVLFMICGPMAGVLLAMPAAEMSRRREARIVAALGMMACALPVLNVLVFFVILLVRGIELGS